MERVPGAGEAAQERIGVQSVRSEARAASMTRAQVAKKRARPSSECRFSACACGERAEARTLPACCAERARIAAARLRLGAKAGADEAASLATPASPKAESAAAARLRCCAALRLARGLRRFSWLPPLLLLRSASLRSLPLAAARGLEYASLRPLRPLRPVPGCCCCCPDCTGKADGEARCGRAYSSSSSLSPRATRSEPGGKRIRTTGGRESSPRGGGGAGGAAYSR